MNTAKHKPIPSDIGEYLSYDPLTGVIKWIAKTAPKAPILIGSHWGTKAKSGYLIGRFRYEIYSCHRVAWFLATGKDPGSSTVDHIHGDRLDNRISQLRLLNSAEEQNKNRGALGYFWDKKARRFRAQARVSGILLHLGCHDCPLLARMAYHDKVAEAHPNLDISFIPRMKIKGRPEPFSSELPP